LALCLERLGLQSSHVLLIPTTGPTKEEIGRGGKNVDTFIYIQTRKIEWFVNKKSKKNKKK
jgi:hypothetical protein